MATDDEPAFDRLGWEGYKALAEKMGCLERKAPDSLSSNGVTIWYGGPTDFMEPDGTVWYSSPHSLVPRIRQDGTPFRVKGCRP